MNITKTSALTGVKHTMDINIDIGQWAEWRTGSLIQDCMPNLTADEREFIMTGITAEEWESMGGDQ